MTLFYALGALFLAAFTAATVLPGQSELVLVWLLSMDKYNIWLLVAVATFGNVAGSVLNWWLGQYVLRFKDRKWFPVSAKQLEKAQKTFNKYGYWSLLLAWIPVLGDPLTVAAGVLRVPFPIFLPLVTISKLGRYLFILAVYKGLF